MCACIPWSAIKRNSFIRLQQSNETHSHVYSLIHTCTASFTRPQQSSSTHSHVYSQSQVGWHFRKLFQSSKLKARTFLFTETWQKRCSSSELSALKELSKMSCHLGLAVGTWRWLKRNPFIGVATWSSHVCLQAHTLHEPNHVHIAWT